MGDPLFDKASYRYCPYCHGKNCKKMLKTKKEELDENVNVEKVLLFIERFGI